MRITTLLNADHDPHRKSSPRLSTTLLTAIVMVALTSCSKKPEASSDIIPTVTGETITFAANDVSLKTIQVAKVEAPRELEINIPGRIVWNEDRTVRVFTPFSGRVGRIFADVGSRVQNGQPLAQLQSPDFATAQADAQKTSAVVTVAKQALARAKELSANGIVSAKDLQQAEADYATAEAESSRANARLFMYGQDAKSHATYQQFSLNSPLAGVVVERNLNPGQELRADQPGVPHFVVTDPTQLWLQLDASESDLRSLKPGTAVLVSATQYPDDTFRGEVRQVSDFIDPVSRTLKIRGTIDNKDLRLKAEMFVTARVTLARGEYPLVPEKAVFLDGVRSFVFVRTGPGVFVRRGIKPLTLRNGMLPVTSGLNENDEVVVAGSLFLQQMIAAALVRSDATQAARAKN
ncbi:MAG: efflux RND transporter periplasmic adaptor subunit [Rhodocyclaceae bacterium]|nr:efflux RND transporter periplasmic adaptor subunit [Rhodocyclaceae bacterium]